MRQMRNHDPEYIELRSACDAATAAHAPNQAAFLAVLAENPYVLQRAAEAVAGWVDEAALMLETLEVKNKAWDARRDWIDANE